VLGQMRPTTNQTLHREDLVGRIIDEVERPLVARAWRLGQIVDGEITIAPHGELARVQCIPVRFDGALVAVITRESALAVGRRTGELERVYVEVFERFAGMIVRGDFPFPVEEALTSDAPRVGDGVLLLDDTARVAYSSPNAINALHRMGIYSNAEGLRLSDLGIEDTVVRTAYELVTGRQLPFENMHIAPIAGLTGVKEAAVKIEGAQPQWSFLEGVTVKVAVAHGLGNARKIIERVQAGEPYHFIEVMTCPGGCIGGGGQPRLTTDEIRMARISAIYKEDEGKPIRKSHANPEIAAIYKDYLGKPLGEKSHHLLHTRYTARERV